MKLEKRIISFAVALLLLLNCVPISYASANAEQDTLESVTEENTEETTEQTTKDTTGETTDDPTDDSSSGVVLSTNGTIYDAITDMEYGWDGTSYRFDKNFLSGVAQDDEVELVADVTTSDTIAGGTEITVELSNFRLEGADAEGYTLPDIAEQLTVQKQIAIFPKAIVITPANTEIYFGQPLPDDGRLDRLADYKDQLLGDDDVKIQAVFRIANNGSTAIGEYRVILDKTPKILGDDAGNYTAVPNLDVMFHIHAYDPDVEAISEDAPSGEYVGVTEAVLKAPEGFRISDSVDKDWKERYTFKLDETLAGKQIYYLRNYDPTSEYYLAVCQKEYHYTALQTKPTVQKIKLELIEDETELNFQRDGVFSNGNLAVTVTVEGGPFAQDTTIYLGEEGNYASQVVKAEDAVEVDGKNIYTAVFYLNTEPGSSLQRTLTAYAENIAGKGAQYPSGGTKDTFEGTQTLVSKPIVIDKVQPFGEVTEIDGNYHAWGDRGAVRAKFQVYDQGAGIAKVEYKWDDGFKLNYYDWDYCTDFVEFGSYSSNKTEYELILPWSQSMKVDGNRHTLYLRVTDRAGNVTDGILLTDNNGSDMLEPNIESIEIRKPQTDTVIEDVIRFLSLGAFYNKTVEIVVKANDNEDLTDYFSSGVREVWINDKQASKTENSNEYVLTVSPDEIMEGMSVKVIDGYNQKKEAYVTEISENGEINSNCLIVEDNAPVIDFGNFLEQGHKDAEQKIWYGSNDTDVLLTVNIKDTMGTVCSGMYSVTIKDNDQVLYEQSNLVASNPADQLVLMEDFSVAYPMVDFLDGEHIISVIAEDNCGNCATDTITFYKDTVMPEEKDILVTAPQSVILDEQKWFSINDTIVFRTDAFDETSGLKNITIYINDQVFEYGHESFLKDDAGAYVVAETAGSAHNENVFVVSAKVTDFANNTVEYAPFTVHVDTEIPTIEKCTVQKKSSFVDRVLKILTFGIYSNDSLVFQIYTKDAELDSGIDYAIIHYEGVIAPEKMKAEGNGVFSFELSEEMAILESTLKITVYDRYGNRSLSCTNIEDAGNQTLSQDTYVMIEQEVPSLTFDLPRGDGIAREDGQVWYNSNKGFELLVQDVHSGINNVSLTVNGVDVLQDMNNNVLIKSTAAEAALQRNNDKLQYVFDTDYFISLCGEAENGKYVVAIETTDNAGNAISKEAVYYLDQTAPVIDIIQFTPGTANGLEHTSDFIETHTYGFYFKQDFRVTVSVSDAEPSSGLYEVKYRLVPYENGTMLQAIEGAARIVDGKAEIDIPKGFKGQFFVNAYDWSLNSSGERSPKACVVDSLPPDIRIVKHESTEYHDAAGNPLYVQTNSITVVITDTVSGLKQFGYQQNAERNQFDRKVIKLSDSGHDKGEDLGDGWIVTGVDANLVTQIEKTFVFADDDNGVKLTFDALDHSLNEKRDVATETFTVDKTTPIIYVSFREDYDSDLYYDQDRVADVTVIERNFDEDLINVQIKNTFGNVPDCTFTEQSLTEHTAVIVFDEGDYTFDMAGMDLGHHVATVNFSDENAKLFYVDKTDPMVQENFGEFGNEAENSFRVDKTAQIKITEHHFDPSLVGLKILEKAAGASHTNQGFTDVTSMVLKNAEWIHNGDDHTISFVFDHDAVYYIEMYPADLAGNKASKYNTVVFEIDKTAPVVIKKNGVQVSAGDTQFLDLYPSARKDADAPSVEFADNNILHIQYVLTSYIPSDTSFNAATINPEVVSGTVDGAVFTLPSFGDDGVYAVKLIAVDVAGNESIVNINTYARMVEQDVLAFIMDSDPAEKTGLYSLEYTSGEPISKKPSSFEDLKIFVLAPKEAPVEIVLRDNNGNVFRTDAQYEVDDSIYGIGVYNYLLRADYFRENFQDDTDAELSLTVLNQQWRIDLAEIHIDNIAPACTLAEGLSDWHWFSGAGPRTFTITDVGELIDEANCKVYDNGKEIPFVYNAEDGTVAFELGQGWHNVGIILCDMAGNTNNIQEIRNMNIGYFWPIVFAGLSAMGLTAAILLVVLRKKKRWIEQDD